LKKMSLRTVQELHNMECELVAQREQMAAKQREHMEEKEKLKRLKVGTTRYLLYLQILLHAVPHSCGRVPLKYTDFVPTEISRQ
jgi:hypothetical protein